MEMDYVLMQNVMMFKSMWLQMKMWESYFGVAPGGHRLDTPVFDV